MPEISHAMTASPAGRRNRRPAGMLAVRAGLIGFSYLVLVFMVAPMLTVIASSFTSTNFIRFPPVGFSFKWFVAAIQDETLSYTLLVSLGLATACAVLSIIVGFLAACGLSMSQFRGREVLTTFFMSPLMVPVIVLGAAMLQFFASLGMLDTVGGVLLGHMLVAVPYAIRLVGVSLDGFDWDLYRAARNLGASEIVAVTRVVLPSAYSGIVAGATFAFIMSFDEVTISLFTTGTKVQTLPVTIYRSVEYSYEPVIAAASSITVGIAALALIAIFGSLGIERVFGAEETR
ncbi:ABC transporter permease [Bosea sp. (in: a-proteobacteria)]|uniref:ABC transporter permease n=1 Tax=Bosea sp. (in: a-proteobacteria) TaxID=1871050 RepID=UPI002608208A|nr:ABC transporter permease [Bosea sp. (in: a-proteobacteria)]MCO5089465.1 ABC transporter permease [Bosea sp. (in: a-proteobacteria)]